MPEDETLPVRYCHGCGKYDTDPRSQVFDDDPNSGGVRMFHYDCVPGQYVNQSANVQYALNSGLTGDALRDHMIEYSATSQEG